MSSNSDFRDSELDKLRDLLRCATSQGPDATTSPQTDTTFFLLSRQDEIEILIGQMIADALHN